MIRPPPRSPLFPYPTLFRSEREDRQAVHLLHLHGLGPRQPCRDLGEPHLEKAVLVARADRLGIDRHRQPEAALERDRKSTRLNSSHSQISYAVFCLKKKIDS